jgi:acetyltransferase-like isoleucine patch superfamily enzyme
MAGVGQGKNTKFAEKMNVSLGYRLSAQFAGTILKLAEFLNGKLRTMSARDQAMLSNDVRVLAGGRIVNIFGEPANVKIGSHARIWGEILTFAHAGRVTIGSWFYLEPGSMIWSSDETGITIVDRVLGSANVTIHDTDSHPIDPGARFEQTKEIIHKGHARTNPGIRSARIKIGNDVWISAGAIILKVVSIGDAAIVGAGSVVTKNVPSKTTVAGNPAREVGRVNIND